MLRCRTSEGLVERCHNRNMDEDFSEKFKTISKTEIKQLNNLLDKLRG